MPTSARIDSSPRLALGQIDAARPRATFTPGCYRFLAFASLRKVCHQIYWNAAFASTLKMWPV